MSMIQALSGYYGGLRQALPDALRARLFLTYWLFLAAQFIIPSNFVYAWWFYLAVGLPLLLTIYHNPRIMVPLAHVPLALWVAALFAYTAFHAFVLTEGMAGSADTIRHIVTTTCFLLATVLCFDVSSKAIESMLKWLLTLLIIAGLSSIVIYLVGGMEGRLEALGQNDHPILGASVYAVFTLFGFYFLQPGASDRHAWLLAGLTFAITMVLILMTQSRGPLIAFCLSTALGLLLARHYKPLLLIIGIGFIVCVDALAYYITANALLPFSGIYDALIRLMERESHRLAIWHIAVELVQDRPWTGYGMQASFPYGYGGVNPHNLFLSALYYTGVPGFALLTGVTLATIRYSLKFLDMPLGKVSLILMVHAVTAFTTDQGQYVNSPSPLWSIYWLPVGMTIALGYRYQSADQNSPSGLVEKPGGGAA